MPRIAKPHEVAAKRDAILDAAQRLVFTRGYDQMSIQHVLADLQISGGAFHHYFDSRAALLNALIERIERQSSAPLLPIVGDPHRSALQKLQAFLHALDRLRIERQADVIAALRVWYTDANAVVRERVAAAVRAQRAPLLTEIVRQGVREGVFTVTLPERAGEVLMALLQAMGDTHARQLLAADVDGIIATHAAYMEAIERVLGAASGSLERADARAVAPWIAALSEER